jgi:predicted ATPase/DNA-binding SARP family transcriptional activator
MVSAATQVSHRVDLRAPQIESLHPIRWTEAAASTGERQVEWESDAGPSLHIVLLGPPFVHVERQPLTIPRRQTRALLYYLAAVERPVSRDQLCLLFWPDVSQTVARRNLVVQLNQLRRVLPPDTLRVTADTIALDAVRTQCDTFDFTAAARSVDAGALSHAVALYSGPFLDGFALPDCLEYDAWLTQERQIWERRYLQTLAGLIEALTVAEQYHAAIDNARRYLDTDPLAEDMHRRLIALYGAVGERTAAMRQFERCAVTLERELGVSPLPETRAVYEAVRDGRLPLTAPVGDHRVVAPAAAHQPSVGAHALPALDTDLIGRSEELAAIQELFRGPDLRLLTLTGPGGSGKTQLALHAAVALRPNFTHGVVFVPLAPLREASHVIDAIAQACGLHEPGGRSPADALRDYLRLKDILILLDNCEHLPDAAPEIGTLLAHAPGLRVLATSRAPLNLSAEHVLPVPPLQVPPLDPLPPLAELEQQPAVALLLARVRATTPSFEITAANARTIAEICARLDGLPLAIELAAARLKLLSPHALLKRLDHRLALLTGGPRDVPDRHQTLRGTIDWSYRLLDLGEQLLFERLAVFPATWTLDAAEHICTAVGELSVSVLDGLHALLDKHLLTQSVGADGEMRFGMLETIHEYARERLQTRGISHAIESDHARYYCNLAEQAAELLRGPGQRDWLARLDAEHPNLLAAIDWALDRGDPELSLRLAGALRDFWFIRGHTREGRLRAERALAIEASGSRDAPTDDATSLARARALDCAGVIAFYQGDYPAARTFFGDSVGIWRALERRRELAISLLMLSAATQLGGNPAAAVTTFDEAAQLVEQLGDPEGLIYLHYSRARDELSRGDMRQARRWYQAALDTCRRLGNSWWLAVLTRELGDIMLGLGDTEKARAHFMEAMALASELKYGLGIALALMNLGETARAEGDYDTAAAHYADSLHRFRDLGNRGDAPRVLHNLGYVALHAGDTDRAAQLFRESLEQFHEQHSDRGVAEGLAGLAAVSAVEQRAERAARLWGAAEALFQAHNSARWPVDLVEYMRYLSLARAMGDPAAFEAAWQVGRALTPDQAVVAALSPALVSPL